MICVSSQGFRLVVPYLDACRVRVKAAWVGRKIEQVRIALTVIATLVHVYRAMCTHYQNLILAVCCVQIELTIINTIAFPYS